MASISDKQKLVERDTSNTLCIRVLLGASLVCVTVFMSVTFLVFLNIQALDGQDVDIQFQIEELKRKFELTNQKKDADVNRDVIVNIVERYVKDSEMPREENTVQHKRQTSNIFELILKAQEKTFEKFCQPHNATCPQGNRGDNGTSGALGSMGLNGTIGLVGDKGPTGDPGMNGTKGVTGVPGLPGDVGPTGLTGQVGDNGLPGDNGTQGAQGDNGLPGTQGKPGMRGDQGDAGQQGPDGQVGPKGPQGYPGEQGDRGENGTQGPAGVSTQPLTGCPCYKKPVFVNPSDETILVSSNTDTPLPCDSIGFPNPALSLYKPPRKAGRDVQHIGNTYSVVKATPADYGEYICTATNMFGSVTKTVTVMERPSAN